MRRDTTIKIAASAVMIGCLAASVAVTSRVAASISRNRLVHTDSATEADPPQVALGIAMGAFRGLFVNFLWIRANDLKEEGKYYEAMDLASTITKLQPRFPRVWAFHGWNLAYNISVTTQTYEERWQWVSRGIALIRDEGIPANPNDIILHRELAWIFLHKIGAFMDDAHWYYKRRLAYEWTAVLGPPPERTLERMALGKLQEAYVEWIRKVADAPETLAQVYEVAPEAREIVRRLREEAGIDVSEHDGRRRFLELFEQLRRYVRAFSADLGFGLPEEALNDPFVKIVTDAAMADAGQQLVRHLRKKTVLEDYHMDPSRMLRYTEKYGPLDWRHPAAHSVYWAAKGVEEGLLRSTRDNQSDYDFLNTDRIVIQAVQDLFRSGAIYFDILNPDEYVASPNVDFVPIYGNILEELKSRAVLFDRKGQEVDLEKRVWSFYSAGYENFLKDAVRYLYRRGLRADAHEWFDRYRNYKGQNAFHPLEVERRSMALEDFVVREINEDDRYTSPVVATTEIRGALEAAFLYGLLVNNRELFDSEVKYASQFHAVYTASQVFRIAMTRGDLARLEHVNEDFSMESGTQLALWVMRLGLPEGATLFRRAPTWMQVKAYPMLARSDLRLSLDAGAQKNQGPAFEVLFPTPPGATLISVEQVFQERSAASGAQPPGAQEGAKVELK